MPYFANVPHTRHQRFHGIRGLMAYVNHDGFMSHRNCGQAAAATALRYKQLFHEHGLGGIEQHWPPDCFLVRDQ